MLNNFICPIERTMSGATNLSQIWPGRKGNEGVLCISQKSRITGASPSDCLALYPGHSFWERSYASVEMQLVYSTAQADWVKYQLSTHPSWQNIYSILENQLRNCMTKRIYWRKSVCIRTCSFSFSFFFFFFYNNSI